MTWTGQHSNAQGGLSMIFCLAQNLPPSRMPSCALLPVILPTCSLLFGNAQLNWHWSTFQITHRGTIGWCYSTWGTCGDCDSCIGWVCWIEHLAALQNSTTMSSHPLQTVPQCVLTMPKTLECTFSRPQFAGTRQPRCSWLYIERSRSSFHICTLHRR